MLASIRPDSLNLPLFVHVLGAMILVGGLLATSIAVLVGARRCRVLRIGAMTLFFVCLPGVPRHARSAPSGSTRASTSATLPDDPTWIGIGFITADAGALLLLISLILAGLGVRRLRAAAAPGCSARAS